MKVKVVKSNTVTGLEDKIEKVIRGIAVNDFVDLKLTSDSGDYVAVILYKD